MEVHTIQDNSPDGGFLIHSISMYTIKDKYSHQHKKKDVLVGRTLMNIVTLFT